MDLKPIKHVETDEEKGIFYSGATRFMLVPLFFFKEINYQLKKIISPLSLQIFIYKFGEGLGRQYARMLKEILLKEKRESGKELLIGEAYNAIFSANGLGKVEIKPLDGEKILVQITDSPSGALFKKSDYGLERGLLAGIHKEIFRQEIYYKFDSEKKAEHLVKLKNLLRFSKKKEKLTLFERKELNDKIRERTRELEDSRIALLNILEDVEEAKADAEKERDKTISIINNLADGLLVFDNEKKLILINPKARDFFKFQASETGKTIYELAESASFEPLANLLTDAPEEIFRKELSLGENLSLEASTVGMMSGEKKLGNMIILHDVTREKTVERMKTEFVSLAAHQLRTPLSAIKWTLKMLLDGDIGSLTQEQKDFLGKTYQSNERIIELINDLLNVARIEEGRYLYKPVSSSLEKLVQSLTDSYGVHAERKKIKIEFQKPEKELPKIMIDLEKMGLAVGNLLENAVRYTPNGGRVTMTLAETNNGGEIKFSIRDSGIGIPKSQHQRVFTKFFRAANAIRLETEGTGLGLFIAKNIIEAHGGKIWFESDEGGGTTFYFTLPVKNNDGGEKSFDDFFKKF